MMFPFLIVVLESENCVYLLTQPYPDRSRERAEKRGGVGEYSITIH